MVVLLHGLVMDGSLWRRVVRELRADHRCVVPTLPFGGHQQPMRANADLSLRGFVRLEAEFLEALDLRLRALRHLPLTFGWMAKRPIPHEITDAWLRPLLTQRKIRRDLLKYLLNYNKGDLLAAAERLRSFDHPALVIWAAEDRVMPPPAHGRQLAALLPHGRLIEIADSYTLIPEDQPAQLAAHIRAFIASEPITAAGARPTAPQP